MCREFRSLFQIKKFELRNPGYAQIPNVFFTTKKVRFKNKKSSPPPLTKNYLFLNRRCRCRTGVWGYTSKELGYKRMPLLEVRTLRVRELDFSVWLSGLGVVVSDFEAS